MTNDEGQMTKESRIPKSEFRRRAIDGENVRLDIPSFELHSSFVIRHSSFLLALLIPVVVSAAPKAKLENIACYPSSVTLANAKSRQGIVIQASYSDGLTRDVTLQARCKLADAKLAKLDKAMLTPLADGKTELRVSFDGKNLTIPVTVSNATYQPAIRFRQ